MLCDVSGGSNQLVEKACGVAKLIRARPPHTHTHTNLMWGKGQGQVQSRAQTQLGQHTCPFTWQLSSPQIACVSSPKINHIRGEMKEHGLLALAFCRHTNASLPFRGWTGWPYLPPGGAPRPRSHLLSGQWGVEFHPAFPLERGCLLSSFHTIERKDKWLNSLQGIKASFSGW